MDNIKFKTLVCATRVLLKRAKDGVIKVSLQEYKDVNRLLGCKGKPTALTLHGHKLIVKRNGRKSDVAKSNS